MRSLMRSLALALLLPATLAATQTISVSGGRTTPAPYYTFDGVDVAPTLVVGTTYEFETSGVSASHPFAVRADGNVVSGSFTVAEGTTYEYVCLAHGSMTATFTISEGTNDASTPLTCYAFYASQCNSGSGDCTWDWQADPPACVPTAGLETTCSNIIIAGYAWTDSVGYGCPEYMALIYPGAGTRTRTTGTPRTRRAAGAAAGS